MSHEFLTQLSHADLKHNWVDVKDGHLVKEKKTFPKRLLYGFCKFITLGRWKKSQGLERALKEVQRIIKEDSFPSTDYKLKETALSKFDPYQKNQKIAKSIQKINTFLAEMPTFVLNPTDVENALPDLTSYAEKHMEKLHWETLLLLGDKTSKDNPKFALKCYEQAYKNRDWDVNEYSIPKKLKVSGTTVSLDSHIQVTKEKDETGQTAYRLRVCYQEGLLAEKDLSKSAAFLQEAVDKGHPEACYERGVELLQETPSEKKLEGIKHLVTALATRHEGALRELLNHEDHFDGNTYTALGKYYQEDKDVREMSPLAEHYYKEGTKRGNVDAGYITARRIEMKPRPTSEEKALRTQFFIAEAGRGHFKALLRLDISSLTGEDCYAISKAYAKAHQVENSEWYLCIAAEKGNKSAFEELKRIQNPHSTVCERLGLCYTEGVVCERNLDQALHFLDRSEEQEISGYPDITMLLNIFRQVNNPKGLTWKALFNEVWKASQAIMDPLLRLKAYELALKIPCDAADEKKKPWIVKLRDDSSFSFKPEEQALLSDFSQVIQTLLSERWESKIDQSRLDSTESLSASVDLSKLPLAREHLEHLVTYLKTGNCSDLNLAIEHILVTDELQSEPFLSAVEFLRQEVSLWTLDDLEDARTLTGFLSTHALPNPVLEELGIYWGKLFFDSSGELKLEALQNLKMIAPKSLDLRTSHVSQSDLEEIAKFTDLKKLAISSFSDEEMKLISLFPNLTHLTLLNCLDWTKEGAGEIQKLKDLKKLNLFDCKLDKEILREIHEIPSGEEPLTTAILSPNADRALIRQFLPDANVNYEAPPLAWSKL